MVYKSGRTKEPFIRTTVVEGNNIYVSPDLYNRLHEIVHNPLIADPKKAEEIKALLALTPVELILIHIKGYTIVVDYDLPPLYTFDKDKNLPSNPTLKGKNDA